jgi:hypothetical protein
MKKYAVCYANKRFYVSQKILKLSALKFGIDEVMAYKEKELRQTIFYKDNRAILDYEKGAGYWLWKPYIVLDAMKKINYGDFLIYLDSGIEVIRSLSALFDICSKKDEIVLFQVHNLSNSHLNSVWTKRDCFVFMNCDSEKYWNAQQVNASVQVYIKNNKAIAFLEEWLVYAKNPHIITDQPNICG